MPGISISKICVPFSGMGGVSYSPEYTTILNAMPTEPSDADKTIQATWLDGMVAGGYYAKAELLDLLSCDTQANSLFNWADPTGAHNPTLNNAPAFTAYTGFKCNAAGKKFIRTHFTPSVDTTLISQNSICVIIGVGEDIAEGKWVTGIYPLTGTRLDLMARSATDEMLIRCNNDTSDAKPNTVGKAHFALSRGGAAGYDWYINLTKDTTARNSIGVVDHELYAGAQNVQDGLLDAEACNNTIRYFFLFPYLTETEVQGVITLTEAYLDNYATGLI
jgi:hypothetical protein